MTQLRDQSFQRPDATDQLSISVVVPVYNEVDNLPGLCQALTHALASMNRRYEILIVDDGSNDGSRALLRELSSADANMRALLFGRNFGQTAAMSAGFDHARGDIVVTMDGDLQNDPADIPRLVAELERGFDIVVGWRRNRQDAMITRLVPSKIANLLISWVTRVPIHDTGCSLKAYRKWVVRSLDLYSDMHRFIAAMAVGVGARVSEIPVRHHARRFGQSKYGLGRVFKVLADLVVIKMLIQFAARPMYWFSLMAFPLFLMSALLFVFGVFAITASGFTRLERFDTFYMTAATVASLVAFNVLLLGFLAELQLRASQYFGHRIAATAREASR